MEPTVLHYPRLGSKTLVVSILLASPILIYYIVILAAVSIFAQYFLPSLYLYVYNLMPTLGLIGLLLLAIVITIGWLRYFHYSLHLYEDSLTYRSGLVSETETGIPYKWIKGVRVHRSLLAQILGLSRLTIMLLGEDDMGTVINETEIVFPPVDKAMAKVIHDFILAHTNLEKEIELNTPVK